MTPRSTPSIPVGPADATDNSDGATMEIGCPHRSWGMVVPCPDCGTPRHVSPDRFVTDRFLSEVERGEREYPGEARPTPVEPEARPDTCPHCLHALGLHYGPCSFLVALPSNETCGCLAVEPDGLPLDVERLARVIHEQVMLPGHAYPGAPWNDACRTTAENIAAEYARLGAPSEDEQPR